MHVVNNTVKNVCVSDNLSKLLRILDNRIFLKFLILDFLVLCVRV